MSQGKKLPTAFLLDPDAYDPSMSYRDEAAPFSLLDTATRKEIPQQLPTCLTVPERYCAVHQKTYSIDGTSSAVGVVRLQYCVGMYCEIDTDRCFVWHAFGRPMDGDAEEADIPGSADHDKIARVHADWLESKLGEASALMRDTLILSTFQHIKENDAIIDGILRWAGVEEKEEWKASNMKACHAFIVQEPAKQDTVVEEYDRSIDWSHPEHYSRKWDVRNGGEQDGIGVIVPSRYEGVM